MADENRGVITGTEGLKPGKLFSNTREMFAGSPAPPVKPQNTGVACPECKAQGTLMVPVMSTGSGLQCEFGHAFKDTDELLRRPHDTIPLKPIVAEQEGHVAIQFKLPASTLAALRDRYPDADKLNATFASLCRSMTEAGTVMIGPMELRQMSDKAGQPLRSGAEIMGVISAKVEEINTLKQNASEAAPREAGGGLTLRRGEIILWLNPALTDKLKQKAEAAGTTPETLLENYDMAALENDWL